MLVPMSLRPPWSVLGVIQLTSPPILPSQVQILGLDDVVPVGPVAFAGVY